MGRQEKRIIWWGRSRRLIYNTFIENGFHSSVSNLVGSGFRYYALWLVLKICTNVSSIISKTNRESWVVGRTHFPALGADSCLIFSSSFHWLVVVGYIFCGWSLQLLWFWFYDTRLKTAVTDDDEFPCAMESAKFNILMFWYFKSLRRCAKLPLNRRKLRMIVH